MCCCDRCLWFMLLFAMRIWRPRAETIDFGELTALMWSVCPISSPGFISPSLLTYVSRSTVFYPHTLFSMHPSLLLLLLLFVFLLVESVFKIIALFHFMISFSVFHMLRQSFTVSFISPHKTLIHICVVCCCCFIVISFAFFFVTLLW